MPNRKTATATQPPPATPISVEETEEQNVCPCCDRGPDVIPILSELGETEIRYMEEFLQVVLKHGGDSTPAESFILDLVFSHSRAAITPADALDSWKDFREKWGYAIRVSRQILQQYPGEFERPA